MTFYVYQRGSPLADSSWSLFSLLKVKLSGGAATVQKGKKKNNDLPGGDAVQTPKWREIPRAVSLTPGPPENDLRTDCLERMQRESFFQERNYSQSSSEQERALQDWGADPPVIMKSSKLWSRCFVTLLLLSQIWMRKCRRVLRPTFHHNCCYSWGGLESCPRPGWGRKEWGKMAG